MEAYTIKNDVTKELFCGENQDDGEAYFDKEYPYLGSEVALLGILINLRDKDLSYTIRCKNGRVSLDGEEAEVYISQLKMIKIDYKEKI